MSDGSSIKKSEYECSKFPHQRKQSKYQQCHNSRQINADDLNSVRHEASTNFRKENREYLKALLGNLQQAQEQEYKKSVWTQKQI